MIIDLKSFSLHFGWGYFVYQRSVQCLPPRQDYWMIICMILIFMHWCFDIKVISCRVVSHFVERQERGVVCMDDDGSIDLEGEEECQSIDDEEDIDDDEEDEVEEDSGSMDIDEEEEDIKVNAGEIENVYCP